MATGVLIALAGLWLLLRTVIKDDRGETLVTKLIG